MTNRFQNNILLGASVHLCTVTERTDSTSMHEGQSCSNQSLVLYPRAKSALYTTSHCAACQISVRCNRVYAGIILKQTTFLTRLDGCKGSGRNREIDLSSKRLSMHSFNVKITMILR